MINTIEKYLQELQAAMMDSDSATRRDAMTDAEDHLRSALAEALEQNPAKDEIDLIPGIIEEYGLPQETADAYRDLETRYPSEMNRKRRPVGRSSAVGRFFAVFSDTRAWGSMLYCLLSLVTGILYFSWTVTGVAVSASMMVLIVGIPIAMAFFFSFHGLAFLEGRLIEALLGERMPRRQRFFNPDMGWGGKIKRLLLGKDSWLAIVYQIIMLPLGIIYFTLMVTLMSVSISFIGAPIVGIIFKLPVVDLGTIVWVLPRWTIVFFPVLGVLIMKATLHLSKQIGWAQGKLAKKMLVV
ncbi:MAG: sensor domain-containing protein [Spirochaetales bacterium]|nr:sensor domain-containing protein [Spirochaetales bacterium]